MNHLVAVEATESPLFSHCQTIDETGPVIRQLLVRSHWLMLAKARKSDGSAYVAVLAVVVKVCSVTSCAQRTSFSRVLPALLARATHLTALGCALVKNDVGISTPPISCSAVRQMVASVISALILQESLRLLAP